MAWYWYLLIAAPVLFLLVEFKSSRPDGKLLNIHPVRRLMFYIMRGRNESQVYFDIQVDATKLIPYMDKARDSFGANFTHISVAATAIALSANPRMNRFVVGKRLYQRNERYITFSMKRNKVGGQIDRAAKIATVKMKIIDGELISDFCKRVNEQIGEERSGKKTKGDKEIDLFNFFPRPILHLGLPLIELLDYFNLLPGEFIDQDPMYTSIFMANLGSLNMGAAYHHLYEYGNCPLFIMVGKMEQRPVVVDGQIVIRPIIPFRFNFDERIDDGINARFGMDAIQAVLEDPERYLGPPDAPKALWPQPAGSVPGPE